MTKNEPQKSYDFYIDLNINNSIKKTLSFFNKEAAYTFFLTHLKQAAIFYYDDTEATISAILYCKNPDGSKHVLIKKNLTKIFKL